MHYYFENVADLFENSGVGFEVTQVETEAFENDDADTHVHFPIGDQ